MFGWMNGQLDGAMAGWRDDGSMDGGMRNEWMGTEEMEGWPDGGMGG